MSHIYDCIRLDPQSSDTLAVLAAEAFPELLETDMHAQKDMHMTLTFRPGVLAQITGHELGSGADLYVTWFGMIKDRNGTIMNVAASVMNDKTMNGRIVGGRKISEFFDENRIPHITIFCNTEAGAKAKDSSLCFRGELPDGWTRSFAMSFEPVKVSGICSYLEIDGRMIS